MSQEGNSAVVTALLCVILIGLNWWLQFQKYGFLNWIAVWPVAFILCAWIASRFFQGHTRP